MKEQDKELFRNYGYGGLGNGCGPALMYGMILIGAMLILSSCKTVQYVPVETIRTEIIHKTDTFIQKDSCVVKDSVFIHAKGDTVWYEKWHTKYIDRWKEVIRTDTLIKNDSIQVPYPMEKKPSRWQQVKMDVGGIALGVCLVFFILIIIKLFLYLKRKVFSQSL